MRGRDRRVCILELLRDPRDAREVRRPRRRQPKAPRRSFEEANPELGLQAGDPFADRRLRHPQRFRCPAEAPLAGDPNEHHDIIEVCATHRLYALAYSLSGNPELSTMAARASETAMSTAVMTPASVEKASEPADAAAAPKKKPKAKIVLAALGLTFVTAGTAMWVAGRGKESTDDAFVEGHVATRRRARARPGHPRRS